MRPGPTRRQVLAGALAAGLAPRSLRAEGAGPRLAALDWGLAALAVDLGVPPVGVAERALYRAWVGEPALPAAVELGLRTAPSLEGLATLRPDLILVSPLAEALRPRLERIAPTFANTTFTAEHAPLSRATAMTRSLGRRLGRAAEAEALAADADRRIARAADALAPSTRDRALLPASLIDGRHLLVYGAGSLFGDVVARLGLRDGYPDPTGTWGSAVRTIEDLASWPAVDLVVLAPVPPDAEAELGEGGLLRRLLVATGGRIHRLPAAWAYGGLSAAARFAELLVAALRGGAGADARGAVP